MAAALALATLFVALNIRAYDGYFQDDELDNISWAPHVAPRVFAAALLNPAFDTHNFRPAGHFYFAQMGKTFGLDFPPYITPLFVIHLVNGLLLFLLMRRLGLARWNAFGATAFWTLSASAFDAYWKPMYVFDLLCATFCLASILCYAQRRWVLSFAFFWLAYKSKELAVMLPAVLLVYELWMGEKKVVRLLPWLAVSLSFGLQGILLNPNKNNDYTFRFTLASLLITAPFYAARFLFFPFSGILLFVLAFIRDRRVWFGLAAMSLFFVPLLFLPGRLFEAYTYLPLACAAIAVGGAASHARPRWLPLLLLMLWLPWNLVQLRHERRAKLALDDEVYPFVETLVSWAKRNPGVDTLLYDSAPAGYHRWGITAAWNLAHHRTDMKALNADGVEARAALAAGPVAFGSYDAAARHLFITIRNP